MTTYVPQLIAGLMGITALTGCGKSSPLEDVLGGKLEILASGFTASHNVKEDKVHDSFLVGQGMYVVFKDLDGDGKLGMDDYCSVNKFMLCEESPTWRVPQKKNPKNCAVNSCATHYQSTFNSSMPSPVKPADSLSSNLQTYSTQEMKDRRSIAPMSAEDIKKCPIVCAAYFSGSHILLIDPKLVE